MIKWGFEKARRPILFMTNEGLKGVAREGRKKPEIHKNLIPNTVR